MNKVLLDVADRVAVLTLNRPEVLNALDGEMARALHEGLQSIADKADLRCAVIRGAGDGFMAGGDITYFKQVLPRIQAGDVAELDGTLKHVHGVAMLLRVMPQPVVAQVHGAVAGFGFSLMLGCDLVIAADNSRFTLAYRHLGVSPDGGATHGLPRHTGLKKAMELTLFGDCFDADDALGAGLINRVVPLPELNAASLAWAQRLAAGPPRVLARTKQLINMSLERGLDAQLAAEQQKFLECAAEPDFAEGVSAFLEKRPPRFTGD